MENFVASISGIYYFVFDCGGKR